MTKKEIMDIRQIFTLSNLHIKAFLFTFDERTK